MPAVLLCVRAATEAVQLPAAVVCLLLQLHLAHTVCHLQNRRPGGMLDHVGCGMGQ